MGMDVGRPTNDGAHHPHRPPGSRRCRHPLRCDTHTDGDPFVLRGDTKTTVGVRRRQGRHPRTRRRHDRHTRHHVDAGGPRHRDPASSPMPTTGQCAWSRRWPTRTARSAWCTTHGRSDSVGTPCHHPLWYADPVKSSRSRSYNRHSPMRTPEAHRSGPGQVTYTSSDEDS